MIDVSHRGPQSGQSGSIFTPQLSGELIVFRSHVCGAKLLPMPALAAELAGDSRISQTPVVDKGFASVQKDR